MIPSNFSYLHHLRRTLISASPIFSTARRRRVWLASSEASQDNIFAAATPTHAKSALAIVRVDGPDAASLYHRMTCPPKAKASLINQTDQPAPARIAKLRQVLCPHTLETLDPEAIVINFPHSGHSTSTFEFHLHGSQAILKSVILALSQLQGFRLAQAGEFTRRRFERSQDGGRSGMNLDHLLGLKHLMDAETDEQRKLAIHQFDGRFREIYQNLRTKLLESMALCEAILDFSEDGSIDDDLVWNQVKSKIEDLQSIIHVHMLDAQRHEKVLNGIRVTLFGAPNVGKSTLLNWLVNREASIVSPYPGTTRDIVQVSLDFHGFPLIVSDTAGLRETEDPVEKIGVGRAQANISNADIRLCLVSAPEILAIRPHPSETIPAVIRPFLKPSLTPSLLLITKCDLVSSTQLNDCLESLPSSIPICAISIPTFSGCQAMIDQLKRLLKTNYEFRTSPSSPVITSATQQRHLQKIMDHLQAFMDYKLHEDDLVIAVEELRGAAWILGCLIGDGTDEVAVEEILGEIFQNFCIGK